MSLELREIAQTVGNVYYKDKRKNLLFNKLAQKQEIAALIADKFSVKECILHTIYRDSHTGIVVDFTLLKLFAHPAIFAQISQHGISLIQQVIAEKGFYDMHINLDSFSISAMDRYRPLIDVFFSYIGSETMFAEKIHSVTIYNPPNFFDGLYKLVRRFVSSDCSHLQLICLPKNTDTNERFYSL